MAWNPASDFMHLKRARRLDGVSAGLADEIPDDADVGIQGLRRIGSAAIRG